jgi:hypothetical protein
MNPEPKWSRLMKKARGGKSLTTLPLRTLKAFYKFEEDNYFYLKHIITHQGLSLDLSESSNFNETVP